MKTEAPAPAREFDVAGMTCAACARRVEKALAAVPGVAEATVNLPLEKATVRGDAALDPGALEAAVAAAGYELRDVAAAEEPSDEPGDPGARRLIGAAVLTIPVVLLAMVGPMHGDVLWVQAALTTPVLFWAGRSFFVSAVKQARHLSANMDTLVALGTSAAYGYSVAALFFHGEVYFETAAAIVTFILLGKYLERRSRRRASEAIRSLLELGAKEARVLRDEAEVLVPVDVVAAGDLVRIRPGERVPADGVVREGATAVDESMLTGEPVPADKAPGDEVYGGTLNTSGSIVVEATRVGAESALAQIAKLVSDAQSRKAPIEHLADRVSAVFVPVVLVLATLTFAGWLVTGHVLEDAVVAGIAVLIIACPCAMGLATPAAIMVGSGRGAQIGILLKGGDVLERSGRLDTVVFDKTGTITHGRMSVTGVVAAPSVSDDEVLRTAASVEAPSEHPLAQAIVAAARERGLPLEPVEAFESTAGLGVAGRVRGEMVRAGRTGFAGEASPEVAAGAAALEAEGKTVVWVSRDGSALGAVAISDTIKPGAAAAVARLHAQGMSTVLLTGDNRTTARAVAAAVGIDDVRAEVLPADKVDAIRDLQASGRTVAMVGDGINDAPALAQADLGVAIGTGADVALEAADLTLVGGDPLLAAAAIDLSRRTLRTIKQNLFWAFAYNVVMIPAAALGFLSPMLAAGAMAFSSVSVLLNALRLRTFSVAR
ncbi:MAG TPA: heavy metal translocating P-type ATPase [Actinomycetota bacterium]|nr:heavy metal translocating P-type ATPase [Actinomycetota bacterium]